jgi:HSP20 family protein
MLVQVRRYPAINPLLSEIADFEREIERAFDGILSEDIQHNRRHAPPIDVVENENQTLLVAELPGVSKEDVRIALENDVLTISGSRKGNQLPENAQWLRSEIRTGEFVRSVRVPAGTDTTKISADLTNGLLTVVMPKTEEVKPREIRVN